MTACISLIVCLAVQGSIKFAPLWLENVQDVADDVRRARLLQFPWHRSTSRHLTTTTSQNFTPQLSEDHNHQRKASCSCLPRIVSLSSVRVHPPRTTRAHHHQHTRQEHFDSDPPHTIPPHHPATKTRRLHPTTTTTTPAHRPPRPPTTPRHLYQAAWPRSNSQRPP